MSKSARTANNPSTPSKKDKKNDLLYTHLSKETIEDLETKTFVQQFEVLTELFSDVPKAVGLYYDVLEKSRASGFTTAETSIFFSVVKQTLVRLLETGFTGDAIDEFKCMMDRVVSEDEEGLEVDKCVVVTDYVCLTYPICTHRRIFQHLKLYQYYYTNFQQQDEISISKSLEFPGTVSDGVGSEPFAVELLNDARTMESVLREKEEELALIAQIDTFPSDIDIFESLSPQEIKQITFDTVLQMVESMQQETDKNVSVQREKTQLLNTKMAKE